MTRLNYICDNKLNTSKAVNYIRKSRKLGKDKVNGTVKKLLKIIDNAYLTKKQKERVILKFLVQVKEY